MTIWRDFDQATLDAQYNTRLQAGDNHEAWTTERQNASAETRRLLSPRLDVAYGPGPRHRLDIFPAPPGASPAPIAIFIHGGYWRSGDKSNFSLIANGLRGLDAAVVVIGYPLCPDASFADVVAAPRDAVRWIIAHASEFGGDPDRLWLFGHSAGAHLVAMCCCGGGRDQTALPPGTVKGAVMTSGMYDLEPIRLSYLNSDLHLCATDVDRFSPLRLEPGAAGPLIVAVGALETAEFIRQAEEFADTLAAKGMRARLAIVPDTNHYTMLQQWRTPDGRLLSQFRSLVEPYEAAKSL
jgi:arylformamidase